MKDSSVGKSMLVNINIPNQPTFIGFIDEGGQQWIILESFISSIGMDYKIFKKYQLSKIKSIEKIRPELLSLQSIANYNNNSNVYLMDKDFFLNIYLIDEIFWKIDNRILPAFAELKNVLKYKKLINELFVRTYALFKNDEIDMDEMSFSNVYADNSVNNAINIDFEKLNELINTAVQKSIENNLPKIVSSISDLFLMLAPGPGTKHYYADKLTTTKPDSDKYFSIRDFLNEKKVSLVFLKLFGGVVANHYGKVAIKYIPPNGNEKSSYNYYPIAYKPLVEKLFTKFSQSFESNKEADL